MEEEHQHYIKTYGQWSLINITNIN